MIKKIKLPLLIVIMGLLLTGSIISIMSLRHIKKKEFVSLSQQFTNQTSSILELWIQDQMQIVRRIAKDNEIVELCLNPNDVAKRQKATKLLKEYHSAYPYYENLPIAIRTESSLEIPVNDTIVKVDNGEFIIDTVDGDTIGKGGEQYSYISEIFNGRDYFISEIYRSIWRQNPIFVISTPVIHENEIIGIAIISPQMDYFTKLFVDSIRVGKTGYMFVVDSSGSIIAHYDRNLILHDTKANLDISNKIVSEIESGNNFFKAKFLDKEKFYYGQKVKLDSQHIKNDLYVIITQEKKDIFTSVNEFALLSLLTVILTSGLLHKTFKLVNQNQIRQEKEKQLVQMNINLENQVSERTQQLESMANRDGLTNLYNRRYIHNYLTNLFEKASPSDHITIGIIDIDDFKKVNDQYGHQIGDQVIIQVGKIIQANLRRDDLVGRYGGEEYLIVLNNIKYKECIEISERIRESINSIKFYGVNHYISVSIGLAKWHNEDLHDVIKSADDNLYEAKANGKNQVVY
jgi:diguanylate cyclase (GGDEF)-like protein